MPQLLREGAEPVNLSLLYSEALTRFLLLFLGLTLAQAALCFAATCLAWMAWRQRE